MFVITIPPFNSFIHSAVTCGPYPHPNRYGYAIPPDRLPPWHPLYWMSLPGFGRNNSGPGYGGDTVTTDFPFYQTKSMDYWVDFTGGFGDTDDFGDIPSRLETFDFPFQSEFDSDEFDDENFDGFPDLGMLNTQAAQVIEQLINITMSIDWQNVDFGTFQDFIQAMFEVIRTTNWENNNFSNINWESLDTSALPIPGMVRDILSWIITTDWENYDWAAVDFTQLPIPRLIGEILNVLIDTDWSTVTEAPEVIHTTQQLMNMPRLNLTRLTLSEYAQQVVALIGREFISNPDWSNINWSDVIDIINLGLPEGFPTIQMPQTEGSLPFLDWTSFNLTALPLPEFIRQSMDQNWQDFDTSLLQFFINSTMGNMDLRSMNTTSFIILESARDTVITLLNMDWQNLNWSSVNDLPIPDSLRPYLYILMHTDWENMDMDTMASLMPTSFQEVWYIAVNMDWENVDWTELILALLPMPDSAREFLYTINNFDWGNFNMSDVNMTAALPAEWQEYVMMIMNMDWRNMRFNNVTDFLMPTQIREFLMMLNETDWSRYNSTADILLSLPLPDDIRGALSMLMETNWTRYNSTFDAISNLPVSDQVKGALLVLLYTDWEMIDWSNVNMETFPIPDDIRAHLMAMMMNYDWREMQMLNLTGYMNFAPSLQEMLQALMAVDWDNFYWTNENITNLPVPMAVSRFMIMMMRTDWESIDWANLDLSTLTIPDNVRNFLLTMGNMQWENMNWTAMVDNLPIPEGNRGFLNMLIGLDWTQLGWTNFTMYNATLQESLMEFALELVRMDWQNFNWQNIDFSSLPMPDHIREMLANMPNMNMEEVNLPNALQVLNLHFQRTFRISLF